MSRFNEQTRVEVEAVHWTGDAAALAALVGKAVTAQPDGSATWPNDDAFEAVKKGDWVVRYLDGPREGDVEVVGADAFAARFSRTVQRAPKADADAPPAVPRKAGPGTPPEPYA